MAWYDWAAIEADYVAGEPGAEDRLAVALHDAAQKAARIAIRKLEYNIEDVEDIAAEAWLYAWSRLPGWRPGGGASLWTYVYGGLRLGAWGAIRVAIRTRRGTCRSSDADRLGEIEARGPSPAESAAANDGIAIAMTAISILDDRERLVFRRSHGLDGEPPTSLAEIGKRLGLSKQRVQQIRDVATRKLRIALRPPA